MVIVAVLDVVVVSLINHNYGKKEIASLRYTDIHYIVNKYFEVHYIQNYCHSFDIILFHFITVLFLFYFYFIPFFLVSD